MNVNIKWETNEIVKIDLNKTLFRDIIKDNLHSLEYNIIDKDYYIKFNNNPLSKILINNQVCDLITKFHGRRVDITPSADLINEIENLKNAIRIKENNLKELTDTEKNVELFYLKQIDFFKIEAKMNRLVIGLNDDNLYYNNFKEVILTKLTTFDTILEIIDVNRKNDFLTSKLHEILFLCTRILNFSLNDTHEFFYTYGTKFLENKEYLEKFCNAYINVLRKLTVDLINKIKNFINDQGIIFKYNTKFCEFFELLELNIIEDRINIYNIIDLPYYEFFSFEDSVNNKIPKSVYFEIKNILAQFHNIEHLKMSMTHLTYKECTNKILLLVLERNIKIYNIYGVKMEDYLYALILFNNKTIN